MIHKRKRWKYTLYSLSHPGNLHIYWTRTPGFSGYQSCLRREYWKSWETTTLSLMKKTLKVTFWIEKLTVFCVTLENILKNQSTLKKIRFFKKPLTYDRGSWQIPCRSHKTHWLFIAPKDSWSCVVSSVVWWLQVNIYSL